MKIQSETARGNARAANGQPHTPNSHPDPTEPIYGPQQSHALAVVRLMMRRKVLDKTRKALPVDWLTLAEFVEASDGLEPETLWRRVRDQYLGNLKPRHPEQ